MDRAEFFERLRGSPRPVVVDLWAPWCLPCRAIAPALERLGAAYAGRVDVWKVNADEHPELARELGVLGIPTLLVYQGDREVARRTGAQPQVALAALFESALGGQAPAQRGLLLRDRLLRLAAAAGLFALGWQAGPAPVLYLAGGVVLFSAVYDRCPLWQALAPRLKKLF